MIETTLADSVRVLAGHRYVDNFKIIVLHFRALLCSAFPELSILGYSFMVCLSCLLEREKLSIDIRRNSERGIDRLSGTRSSRGFLGYERFQMVVLFFKLHDVLGHLCVG